MEEVDVLTEGSTTRVTVKANVWPGQQLDADTLPSLLVYTNADGARHGINVAIPVGVLKKNPPASKD